MSIKYLTQPELKRFFAGIDIPRDRALFGMIYHYGLRVTEATLVKPSDLDFSRKTIHIYRLKGGNGGVKPLPPSITRLLEEYLMAREPTGDALVTGKRGSLGRHRFGQLFKRYTTKAGLSGFSVHCLRHSIATHMLEAGFELEVVKNHLGHKNIQSTLIYAQITDKRLVKVFHQMEKSSSIVKVLSTERSVE